MESDVLQDNSESNGDNKREMDLAALSILRESKCFRIPKAADEETLRRIHAVIEDQFEAELNYKQSELEEVNNALEQAISMRNDVENLLVENFLELQRNKHNEEVAKHIEEQVPSGEEDSDHEIASTHAQEKDESYESEHSDDNRKREMGSRIPTDFGHPSGGISRYHLTRKIIIGNTSKFIPENDRSTNNELFRWTVYVKAPQGEPDISGFVSKIRFFLHASYSPHNVVDVDAPPFHLNRRGWGEFSLRIQLHFTDPKNKPIDIMHKLQLDDTQSGETVTSKEMEYDIELDREWFSGPDDMLTDLRAIDNPPDLKKEEPENERGVSDGVELVQTKTAFDDKRLHFSVQKYPLITKKADFAYSTAPNRDSWQRWSTARQSSSEWLRARQVRQDAGLQNSWTVLEVVHWLRQEKYTPISTGMRGSTSLFSRETGIMTVHHPGNSTTTRQIRILDEFPLFCKYCGSVHAWKSSLTDDRPHPSRCCFRDLILSSNSGSLTSVAEFMHPDRLKASRMPKRMLIHNPIPFDVFKVETYWRSHFNDFGFVCGVLRNVAPELSTGLREIGMTFVEYEKRTDTQNTLLSFAAALHKCIVLFLRTLLLSSAGVHFAECTDLVSTSCCKPVDTAHKLLVPNHVFIGIVCNPLLDFLSNRGMGRIQEESDSDE